jgi:type IV pilus assembly protein PilE
MRGMTLIELMIVVVIVGILASIGVPSYRQYVIRATRTEAKAALLRVQAAEEKFYLQNSRYAVGNELTSKLNLSEMTENGNYKIEVKQDVTLGTQGYTATATPDDNSGQKKDTSCRSFSIDHTGKRLTDTATPQSCWR